MRDFSEDAMVKPLEKTVITVLKLGETLVINETFIEKRVHAQLNTAFMKTD